ncbi:gluconokinase [Entomobacter blattae]|uniref:Gluconokinase n=1 Tax=Entomobacter blattae TaxID=2762277 RepID=A0A7H1NRE3_9PROT|nr:gluconokinase [Entomobacter blattae]QNT78353.1 hypothetical protein JGUZn3_11260 [Entomobacter blattae]
MYPDSNDKLVHLSTALRKAGAPRVLVVMGVAGCGKSTVAELIGNEAHWPVVEGDALHPKANIDKMSAGIPLNDEDRQPWLEKIALVAQNWIKDKECGIVTCSALKRKYRDIIAQGSNRVCFLYLKGTKEDIAPRLQSRTGHFMPASMLDSQFATLEEPADDEVMMELDVRADQQSIAKSALRALRLLTSDQDHPLHRACASPTATVKLPL